MGALIKESKFYPEADKPLMGQCSIFLRTVREAEEKELHPVTAEQRKGLTTSELKSLAKCRYGFSQREIGKKAGFDGGILSRFEQGECYIEKHFEALLNAYEVVPESGFLLAECFVNKALSVGVRYEHEHKYKKTGELAKLLGLSEEALAKFEKTGMGLSKNEINRIPTRLKYYTVPQMLDGIMEYVKDPERDNNTPDKADRWMYEGEAPVHYSAAELLNKTLEYIALKGADARSGYHADDTKNAAIMAHVFLDGGSENLPANMVDQEIERANRLSESSYVPRIVTASALYGNALAFAHERMLSGDTCATIELRKKALDYINQQVVNQNNGYTADEAKKAIEMVSGFLKLEKRKFPVVDVKKELKRVDTEEGPHELQVPNALYASALEYALAQALSKQMGK